ncbi:MAG: cupin domain-containing protein [Pirellulaceae bacterium]|nr:cupin domain-containing protein [Pirellulaceae bacterium]
MEQFRKTGLITGTTLASDDTIHMEVIEIAREDATGPRRHPGSDMVALFLDGRGQLQSADRVSSFIGPRHVHVAAGSIYEIRNTGSSPIKMMYALCPNGVTEQLTEHAPSASSGGATLLGITRFDRFPDSGLVRGGMFFLEPGEEASYHSHEGAPEIFVFLSGICDVTTEDKNVRVSAGDMVYVAPEMKHRLGNAGTERLVVWLTVTPNVTPSHTFYKPQPDGTWVRTTTHLDGKPILPPSA